MTPNAKIANKVPHPMRGSGMGSGSLVGCALSNFRRKASACCALIRSGVLNLFFVRISANSEFSGSKGSPGNLSAMFCPLVVGYAS